MTEREALIAFNRIQGVGAITARRIAEALGSVAAAAGRTASELRDVTGIGPERAALLAREMLAEYAEAEEARAAKTGVTLVTWEDGAYPAALKAIADPPLVLYVAGDAAALDTPSVAIVGTRHPTLYGRETARLFGFQLAAAGYTVVSGLAEGIDSEAHAGALKAKGRTVAVLGGALDCLYPKSNAGLARQIASGGGAVVSEYPFGRQPDSQTFPMRNRIVSGLSKGVLVVEAPLKSGTLITAGQAAEQGRPVMVVPGRIDSGASQGCHRLLKEGARLVTDAGEVIEEVQGLFAAARPAVAAKTAGAQPAAVPVPQLSEDERAVLAHVAEDGAHVDALIRASGLDAGRVNAVLVGLQIRRQVRLLPGGFVKRT